MSFLIKYIQVNDHDLIDALLKAGHVADLTARFLAKHADRKTIEILVKHNIDIKNLASDTYSIYNLLFYACAYNQLDLVKYLLDFGFNPIDIIKEHDMTTGSLFSKHIVLRDVLDMAHLKQIHRIMFSSTWLRYHKSKVRSYMISLYVNLNKCKKHVILKILCLMTC